MKKPFRLCKDEKGPQTSISTKKSLNGDIPPRIYR